MQSATVRARKGLLYPESHIGLFGRQLGNEDRVWTVGRRDGNEDAVVEHVVDRPRSVDAALVRQLDEMIVDLVKGNRDELLEGNGAGYCSTAGYGRLTYVISR